MKYYVTTLPGIENVFVDEIKSKLKNSGVIISDILKAKNNTLVVFSYNSDVRKLLSIKTSEDLYICLGIINLMGNKQDLGLLKSTIKQISELNIALPVHRKLLNKSIKHHPTYRVVAQAWDADYEFRRVDAQRAVEKGIGERFNNKWKLVDDNSSIEIWLHLIKKKAILGLRISDRTMRHRKYKVSHIPASLRPTIALALVWLSKIEDNDIFLDPMCGAGTILIERAEGGRYKLLIGGDIDPVAVKTARDNIGNKYKPISVQQWDAQNLMLDNNFVDKIVCNLPFGKKIGSHENNKVLYHNFFKEVERVLKEGGRAVFLSSERDLINDCLKKYNSLKLIKQYGGIIVLGYPADMFVIKKDTKNYLAS